MLAFEIVSLFRGEGLHMCFHAVPDLFRLLLPAPFVLYGFSEQKYGRRGQKSGLRNKYGIREQQYGLR